MRATRSQIHRVSRLQYTRAPMVLVLIIIAYLTNN